MQSKSIPNNFRNLSTTLNLSTTIWTILFVFVIIKTLYKNEVNKQIQYQHLYFLIHITSVHKNCGSALKISTVEIINSSWNTSGTFSPSLYMWGHNLGLFVNAATNLIYWAHLMGMECIVLSTQHPSVMDWTT